mmetsp:Transcript_14439/g.41006  ORF Transcript_14439/g.41006 Transcript_14439/m.41006 type:complete len:986 (+) Transcript_14439:183-3140(+)|eukprot:CAMPEP_0119549636 /NCGR_PEP_ID=MMETSP1352-20130426/3291_1 /TAXON_ID=265584 /ORGANISM="Stauroneis constricta, Strain CCMP1120" /LENGTH=985 /DNA_ID=CAMNT_0007595233 /DNA_START=117 /DNA_END=3074 /DNA_ORIENTATION=+
MNPNDNNNNNDAVVHIVDDMFSTLPTLEQIQRASKADLLRQYSCGCTPLRHAIKHGAALDVVQLLLQKAPEAMDKTNSHGNVVLSHIKNSTVPEVALLIARSTSDASLVKLDLDGDFPLHCLLQNKATDAVLETTIARCPSSVFSHVNNTKRSALHEAVIHGASLYIIEKLVTRCPEALRKCDVDGKLPLHWMGHWTSLATTQYLLAASHPNACTLEDKEGRIPLHTAIQSTAPVSVIEYMIQWSNQNGNHGNQLSASSAPLFARTRTAPSTSASSSSSSSPTTADHRHAPIASPSSSSSSSSCADHHTHEDDFGDNFLTPSFHFAKNQDCCSTVSMVLLKSDRHGRLPLHMVLDYSASNVVWKNHLLKVIVRQCPAAAWSWNDHKGRLPLHCLRFISRLDGGVLRAMVQKSDPKLLLQQDHRGRTPLHVALEDPHVRTSTIHQLLGGRNNAAHHTASQFEYPVLNVATTEGHLPLHTAALFQASTETIKFLLDRVGPHQINAMCRYKDQQGCLPVHLAVQRRHARPPAKFVNLLLGDDDETLIDPAAVNRGGGSLHPLLTQDEVGQLPLHCAICFRTSTDIMALLVSKTPAWGFSLADFRYRIPLRCAIEASTSAFIFQKILDKTPSDVFDTAENSGNLMLHYLPSSVSVDAVDLLSARYPQLLTTHDSSGRLPIHRAIVRLASPRVLENMIDHAPETLQAADSEGRLPIHLLPDSGHGLDHVNLLIRRSGTRALLTPDRYGQLPLHRAVSEEMRLDVIQALVVACPSALEVFDHDEKLPLHHALLPSTERASWRAKRRRGIGATNDPSIARWAQWQKDLVMLLMSKNPQTLQMQDRLGRLPLHRAAVHVSSIPVSIFQKLIEKSPGSIKIQDSTGRLPLHYALEHWNGGQSSTLLSMSSSNLLLHSNDNNQSTTTNAEAFVQNLQVFLDAFSGAIYVKDNERKLPLHLAMLAGAPIDALYMLNRLAPDLLPYGDEGSSPMIVD